MEEEKAAAYYEELTRKGEGAARFKQGLGFTPQSSSSFDTSTKGSAFPSSSSFLSSFVKASGGSIPDNKSTEIQKQSQLENIQNKLKKKQNSESLSRVSDNRSKRRSVSRERDRSSRRRSRSRDGHDSRRRNRSSSRDRDRDRERIIERRRRSRSRSSSDEERRRRRRSSREIHSRRRRSRSTSPRRNRESEKGRGDGGSRDNKNEGKKEKEKNGGIDYSRLIKGYEGMTPAERVKAKMKLQLSQTVEKDSAKGMGAGWERFEFNKDAPLDDEEMEVVEDDKALVKNIGQSFRFSAVEAKREEQIKAAHDAAMFGTPAAQPSSLLVEESIVENDRKENKESNLGSTLISEKVLEKQQGSWRDRARKLQDGSKS